VSNTHFQFKQFRIEQAKAGMKVTTDGCLFGALVATQMQGYQIENALDIGTGTGLLTLMLAQKLTAQFEAIEVELSAFEEAQSNFRNSPWSDRIAILKTDIKVYQSLTKYDLIICNPPFFGQSLKGSKSNRNQAIHDDLLTPTDLSAAIFNRLRTTGNAYVMYPLAEMNSFISIAQEMGLHLNKSFEIRDKEDAQILRVVGQFSANETALKVVKLIIKNSDGGYTDDFIELLKPYYLQL
jgi:tRNA1Val (adenine37-N6)-methyltransferase